MKKIVEMFLISLLVMMIGCSFVAPLAHAEVPSEGNPIRVWSIMWGGEAATVQDIADDLHSDKWIQINDLKAIPSKPEGVNTAWIKIDLPSVNSNHLGVYISEMFAQHSWVYVGDQFVEEMSYHFPYDVQRFLLPLSMSYSNKTIYLKIETTLERLGIYSDIRVDEYSELLRLFVIRDLGNIILGCSFFFIAFIMLICSFFLKKSQLPTWISLSILILSMGMIFLTCSPFMFTYFERYGSILLDSFDFSLAVFLPSLTFFFEKVFDDGKLRLIRRFRYFQVIYSILMIVFMVINQLSQYKFSDMYYFVSITLLGYIILLQLVILIRYCVVYAMKGNKDAIICSTGIALFAILTVIDLVCYNMSSFTYQIFLWKWGIVGFVISLIVTLGRRFAANQEQLVNYSKELEFYNQQLQLSEKMEMISSLAASVAHEVRNPLQVTRGFLQLVAGKTDDKNKAYMMIAIEELDRASHIITDFLTFAKPELEELTELNIAEELVQIEGIIVPLATLHGGRVYLDIPQDLYIIGNSSKLKQAFINMIKNSIEAFHEDGHIHIWAYGKNDKIFIHIKDNGEGIEPSKLSKLGEPYFSTKTKGTGLGLMVTFRIIEAMKGHISFKSQMNLGTEAVIEFPAASQSTRNQKGTSL
ncbi:ATP-binding protein [Paenibacillus sp. N3.4]|uniref:ATP-binding protein n=1 Tax=Paenibacillus sp. N3.4 TaxID=2603222 RepID=UPI0021C28D9E|nr:ATP-binding protein [Paenibacillus sp. N3.4]